MRIPAGVIIRGGWDTHTGDVYECLDKSTDVEILGECNNHSGYDCLDNVYIAASSPISTFDADYEGWRVIGDVQGGSGMPNYHSTGGNLVDFFLQLMMRPAIHGTGRHRVISW